MRLLQVNNYKKLFQLYFPNYIYLFTFNFHFHFPPQSVWWIHSSLSVEKSNERMVWCKRWIWWEHGDWSASASTWTFHFKFLKGNLRAEEVNSAQFNPPEASLAPSLSFIFSHLCDLQPRGSKGKTAPPILPGPEYFFIRAENVRDGGCPCGVRPTFWFLSKFVPAHNPDTRGEILNIIEILIILIILKY